MVSTKYLSAPLPTTNASQLMIDLGATSIVGRAPGLADSSPRVSELERRDVLHLGGSVYLLVCDLKERGNLVEIDVVDAVWTPIRVRTMTYARDRSVHLVARGATIRYPRDRASQAQWNVAWSRTEVGVRNRLLELEFRNDDAAVVERDMLEWVALIRGVSSAVHDPNFE